MRRREWKVYQQAWGADPETEISLAGSGVPEGLGWNWQYMESSQVGEGKQKFTSGRSAGDAEGGGVGQSQPTVGYANTMLCIPRETCFKCESSGSQDPPLAVA